MPRHSGSLVHHRGIRPLGRIVVTHGPRKELHGSSRTRGRIVHHRKPIAHKAPHRRLVVTRKRQVVIRRGKALKRKVAKVQARRRVLQRHARRKRR